MEEANSIAVSGVHSLKQYFTVFGLYVVLIIFGEDLDFKLWHMTIKRDETVLQLSQRLRDSVRMFAELPEDAEVIPEVQQCRFFKRAMPRDWQDKLAASGL